MNRRHSCPSCGAPMPQSLGNLLQSADVDYYICASCAHLWEVPKALASRVAGDPAKARAHS